MKKVNIIFWITTIIFCGFMLFSAISEIRNPEEAKEIIHHLGYPDYFNPFIGFMKVLGVIALLVPGFPRLKEWAYAGFFFDLLGATYSQIATDGFMPQIAFMLVFFLVWGISYYYSHKRLNAPLMTAG
ncbi:MAG TPA: DoxX family protein [Puia sp.]|nr:DoxX family protein [Puia sp.]